VESLIRPQISSSVIEAASYAPPKRIVMEARTSWETFKAEGEAALERLKAIIHEGNVRRVVIQHEGRLLARVAFRFPLSVAALTTVLFTYWLVYSLRAT